MSEYPVNRGIGKPVEFKGLKSQYLFIFAGGLLARVRSVHYPVHGRCKPVGVHRVRRYCRPAARMADFSVK